MTQSQKIFTFGVSKILWMNTYGFIQMCLSFQNCDAWWLKIFFNQIKV